MTTVGGATTATSSADQFTFLPTVTASTANLADSSATITINGNGFSALPAYDSVTFNTLGVVGTVTSATATQLIVTVSKSPTALGSLTAVVTANGISSGTAVQVGTVVNGTWVVNDASTYGINDSYGNPSDVTFGYVVGQGLSEDPRCLERGHGHVCQQSYWADRGGV